jgi:PilZ domain
MNEPRKVSTYISPDVEDLVPCEPNCDVERRKSVRHKASQFVALKSEQTGNIAELVDISNYGAKIRLIDGATLMINERVVITFINHAATECKVLWQENEHIGILFREPFDHVEEALTIEHLGNGYFVEIKRLQNAVRGT